VHESLIIAFACGCLRSSCDKVDAGYLLNRYVFTHPLAADCRSADFCPSARPPVKTHEKESSTKAFEAQNTISTVCQPEQPRCILDAGVADPEDHTECQKLIYAADGTQGREYRAVPSAAAACYITTTVCCLDCITYLSAKESLRS